MRNVDNGTGFEMVSQLDNVYRLDHAVTAAQKIILKAFDQKIEKAQSDVVKAKKNYDLTVSTLKDLMDKRDALKRDELINTIMKSEKSYNQIFNLFNSQIRKIFMR